MITILAAIYGFIGIAFGTLAYRVETDGWIPLRVVLTSLFWPIYLAIGIGTGFAEVGKELQVKNSSNDLGRTWKQFKKHRS